ncbi:MAG: hypothetical protein KatS3mg010_1008 [Acidimicrobiia bacterium]|nr:MAG: hypothetical protein KatS3mg010_1008 [Acidimicrobiia bacterium]
MPTAAPVPIAACSQPARSVPSDLTPPESTSVANGMICGWYTMPTDAMNVEIATGTHTAASSRT